MLSPLNTAFKFAVKNQSRCEDYSGLSSQVNYSGEQPQ
jgi:hypothetical protein